MHLALPPHIADYRISPRAATDDLLTLGRYFSEMGGYASSISLREARSFAGICEKRLCKVTKELKDRQVIDSVDDLFSLSTDSSAEAYTLSSPYDTLYSLSVNDLERIYRSHPKRADLRRAQGREPLTYYLEGKIVAELRRRSPSDLSEQLKIDYCIHTYENELENLSFLLSRPVRTGSPLPITDINPDCSSDELLLSIISLKQYRDIISRERLIEYTDIALDRLEQSEISGNLPLLAEIAEIRRKKIIAVPEWVNSRLEKGVAHAIKEKNVKDSDLAVPVLTLYAITGNPKMARKATRILNHCYRAAFNETAPLPDRIENLHTAVTCCDFLSRFSPRKTALLSRHLLSLSPLSPHHRRLLQEITPPLQ